MCHLQRNIFVPFCANLFYKSPAPDTVRETVSELRAEINCALPDLYLIRMEEDFPRAEWGGNSCNPLTWQAKQRKL